MPQNRAPTETVRFEQLIDRAELECSLWHLGHARKFIAVAWLVHDAIERRGGVVNVDKFLALTEQLQRAEKTATDLVQRDTAEAASSQGTGTWNSPQQVDQHISPVG
jgi:hypothetical protein